MSEQPSRAAAFFDLDRTLISGSSAYTFGVAAWRAKMLPTRQLVGDAAGALTFRLAGASDDKTSKVRDRILGAVKGVAQDDLVALNGTVIPTLLEKVRPEAKTLIEMHRKSGRHTYIVSASPIEVVDPLAKALGMTGGIGTQSQVVDGIYTGELDGPFVYGEGKAVAIKALAAETGYELDRCYSYSDSASDLPMLEAVGHPVAVNPDSALEAIALRRAWPIVIFHRRTKEWAKRSTAALGATGLAAASFAGGLRLGKRHRPAQGGGGRGIGVRVAAQAASRLANRG